MSLMVADSSTIDVARRSRRSTMDAITTPDQRPAELRRLLVVGGRVAAAVIVVSTALGGLPPAGTSRVVAAVITIVALALWLVALDQRVTSAGVLTACLVSAGIGGAVLDVLHPRGPGYILAFMAMAGIGMRLPRGTAYAAGGVVVVAACWAEAVTSSQPLSAILNLAIGAGFLLVASAFAAANREARDRADELLRQVEETRLAREEAAVLVERGRIARELHDVLAHTLSGLSVQLEGARLLAGHTGADGRLVQQVTSAQSLARSGIVNAQRAIAALRGDALPGPDDLAELADQARLASGASITYEAVGAPRVLPAEQGLALYRTVQEALSNITKHARGAATEVRLTWAPHGVEAEVVDHGGASSGLPSGGFGLSGLAERAALAGGRLDAGPTVDGWRVHLEIPDASGHGPRRQQAHPTPTEASA
jgi:signal transduction histidine kinase